MSETGRGSKVSRVVTPPAGTSAVPAIDLLWLDTLNRIVGRAAHELKGALNGVSVNLEVVRSRAERPDTQVSAVTKFANSASGQLDAVISMCDALLALARASRPPVDIGACFRKIEALVGPAATADGRQVDRQGAMEDLGATTAPGSAVRLAIGASLLAAIDSSMRITCRAEPGDVRSILRIEAADGSVVQPLADGIIASLRAVQIEIQAEPSAISISFPR